MAHFMGITITSWPGNKNKEKSTSIREYQHNHVLTYTCITYSSQSNTHMHPCCILLEALQRLYELASLPCLILCQGSLTFENEPCGFSDHVCHLTWHQSYKLSTLKVWLDIFQHQRERERERGREREREREILKEKKKQKMKTDKKCCR